MVPVAAAVLALLLAIGMFFGGRALLPNQRALLTGAAAVIPATLFVDILHLSGVSPIATLVVIEGVTIGLIVHAAVRFPSWSEILCAAWLVAGCCTMSTAALVAAVRPLADTERANVDLLLVSVALFVAMTVERGTDGRLPRNLTACLVRVYVWVRVVSYVATAGAALDLGAELSTVGIGALVVANAAALAVVLTEIVQPTHVESLGPCPLPERAIFVLTAGAVVVTSTALILVPGFARWSIVEIAAGGAVALLAWQVLTNRRLHAATDASLARERYVRSLLRDATDVIVLCDEQGRTRFVSPAAAHVLDGALSENDSAATLLGVGAGDFAVAVTTADRGERSVLTGRRGTQLLEGVLVRRDDADREYVLSIRDVTERDTMRANLRSLASIDPLTGLANRAGLLEQTDALLSAGHAADLFCLFVDLDRFKHINDASGHSVGDAVLGQVAARLRECVDGDTLLARLGGDEFVIVLDGSARVATKLAEHVARLLSRPFVVDGHVYQIGASVGVARGDHAARAEDLVQMADLAMYEAKQHHKPFCLYEPSMSTHVRQLAARDHDLAQEWGRGSVEIFLQPIVALDTLEVHATEALLRWRRADGGIDSPAAVLAFAERTGRLGELTGWVVEEVFVHIGSAPGIETPVAVNMPPVVLAEPEFAAGLAARVAALGIQPSQIILEITEEDVVEQGAAGLSALQALHREGFALHIDDFGTGFSSLSYLIRLPVRGLKVDRSLVVEVLRTKAARSVVLGLVSLSRELGIDLVAEGVETREQHEALRALGVPYAQGYWYGRPEPASVIADRSRLASWSAEQADAPR